MDVFTTARARARTLCAFLVVAVCTACGGSDRIEPGLYRAALELPGGEAPFGLELERRNEGWVAYLINGPQRVEVTQVTVKGRRLSMSFPGYVNTLEAKVDDGELEGEVVLVGHDAVEHRIAFTATPGQTHRFSAEPHTDNADLSGRWAVEFVDREKNAKTPAIGEFRQQFHEVTGTFLTPAGDTGYLAGEVRDEELQLSTFDGGRAYLFKARLLPDGKLQGTWWSSLAPPQEFGARRDEAAELADPDKVVAIRDDTWPIGFTFADEAGRAVSFADTRYRGKVVIVTLNGSWCPNSHDAVAFLAPFYKEQRARGVEVVALMFEHYPDPERAAGAVKALRAEYHVDFPTLLAGISDTGRAAQVLPQLSGVHAFPTLLFVDRRGRVRRIYTGFAGPATGERHERMTQSFAATVDALVEEKL
ncbi:MAG TPA: TlpA disulfide reductase family protein [Steroidobacteraceae bacterium]|nr:TlpA disulfide reductase family protein [Steroidobacteraceae bacterium]